MCNGLSIPLPRSEDILTESKPLTFGANLTHKGPDCHTSRPQQEHATLSCHLEKKIRVA